MKRILQNLTIAFLLVSVCTGQGYDDWIHTYGPGLSDLGTFNVSTSSSFFSGTYSGTTLSDISNELRVRFGIFDYMELGVRSSLMESSALANSATYGGKKNLLFNWIGISTKMGEMNFSDYVGLSFFADMRYPLDDVNNSVLKDYHSRATEGRFGLFLGYRSNPSFPIVGHKFKVNAEYYNHNDNDTVVFHFKGGASEVNYRLAYSYSMDRTDFFVEFWGNQHLTQPSVYVLARQPYKWISPGVRLRYLTQFWVDVGFDYLLSGNETKIDPTYIANPDLPKDISNYPDWRVNLNFHYMPAAFEWVGGSVSVQKRQEKQIKDIIDQGNQINDKSEELVKLQEERLKVHEELEELRKLLNDDGGGITAPKPGETKTLNPEEDDFESDDF